MDPFEDEYNNNPHDDRLERALAEQGTSIGDVQELTPWYDRPQTDQEAMDAMFYSNKDAVSKFKMDSILEETMEARRAISPAAEDDSEDENHPSWTAVHAAFDVTKKYTPRDDESDLLSGEMTDTGAMTTGKDAYTIISTGPALMPSTLVALGTSYRGSPNANSTTKYTTPATDSPEYIAEHDSYDEIGYTYKPFAISTSMIKECVDTINSPISSMEEGISPLIKASETPASTSTSVKENLNHSIWSETPAKLPSTEKPSAMAEVDWLKDLDGIAAPDYDGEWEDSPSRGQVLMQKKLLKQAAITEPVSTMANAPKSRLTSVADSNSRVVTPTITESEEELAANLEDVDLDSDLEFPVRKAVKKHIQMPTKKPSIAANANKENITGAFTEENLRKQPANSHPPVLQKTLNASSPYTPKLASLYTLQTPTGVSPMPTYTQIKAQAHANMERDSTRAQNSPKSPIDSDENLIDGEYADVSMDNLDYEMGNCGSKDYPTYYFPGTYEATKHDTYEAVKNISSAAYSFGSALGVAGIGKAVLSVGALVGKGARRTGKVAATTATMGAVKLGYKESLPANITQWAEETSYNEALKAEKKKPIYKLAGVQYKKGDPRNYILKKTPSTMQGKSIDFDDDPDEDDWTVVNVKGSAEQPSQQAGEQPSTEYQDGVRDSVYETLMTAVENTATVTVSAANHVGRNVSRVVRSVRAQPHDYFEQRKIAENWPKNLKELEWRNKIERRQSIPRHLDPDFEKVRDPRTGKPRYKRPDVSDPDDIQDDFDGMVLSDDELKD